MKIGKYSQHVKISLFSFINLNTPKGIRIPVTSVKGKCPRPLDDGGLLIVPIIQILHFNCQV